MALINCPECGKEISDTVKKCPQCGFKITNKSKNKKILLISIISVFVLFIVCAVLFVVLYYLPQNELQAFKQQSEGYVAQGDYENAIMAYEQVLIINDSDENKQEYDNLLILNYKSQADTFISNEEYDNAIDMYNKIIEIKDLPEYHERISEIESMKIPPYTDEEKEAACGLVAIKKALKAPDSIQLHDVCQQENGGYAYDISAQNSFGGTNRTVYLATPSTEENYYELRAQVGWDEMNGIIFGTENIWYDNEFSLLLLDAPYYQMLNTKLDVDRVLNCANEGAYK